MMRQQQRMFKQIRLTARQRWVLCTYALPGCCIWSYIAFTCGVVLTSLVGSASGAELTPNAFAGVLINLVLLGVATTWDLSWSAQQAAWLAIEDLYHGWAFATTDRVVNISDRSVEFAIVGTLYPQRPDVIDAYHGHFYALSYSPRTGTLWSLTPES